MYMNSISNMGVQLSCPTGNVDNMMMMDFQSKLCIVSKFLPWRYLPWFLLSVYRDGKNTFLP